MKILLIDGNSVLFRAFYATSYNNIMHTSFGVYTNAIYAFANMLNKALALIKPDYCCVAFDKGKNTFRHKLTKDYKAGRKETPPELVQQFFLVREMLDAYNIKHYEYDDIEADDIIGILAKKFNIETCIFSSDHDLFQLIDKTTKVYCMKKGMSEIAVLDEKGLFDEMGLKPYQIIDYKGLAGDKSDNIKGVEGVGDKTAVKLLQDYDTCEGIYEHIDEIKGKLKDKLLADKESCFLSKKLATILVDKEIDIELEDIKLDINEDSKNEFFIKYEMNSLVNKSYVKKEEPKIKGNIVKTISKDLLKDSFVYFASNDFSYFERELFGLTFTNGKKFEYIEYKDFIKDNDAIKYLASDSHKVVYGLKEIKHQLSNYDISIGDNTDDVMLMCFLVNNNHNEISKITFEYGFNINKSLKDIVGTIKKPIDFKLEDLADYSFEISDALYKIYNLSLDKLKKNDTYDLYINVELPLVNVLYDMEKTGIICDIKELDAIAEDTLDKIKKLEKNIYKLAKKEFNINSPLQLKEVLFTDLDLPDLKKGSTNAEALIKIVEYHPIVEKILEYRKYSKLYSTYAEGLKKYICKDHRIHTIYSQNSVATGRLSSLEPNLQNISVRDDESKEIRKAFKPSKGCTLVSLDYSQIELRVLASLSNEKKMIDAFNSNIDIHTKTAMDVFGLKEDEVSSSDRRKAKAVNFGVVYGISDFGLANQTSLSFGDAKKFINNYFENYPNIKKYLDNQVKFCEKNGYVKTMMNRRRYIDEIKSNKWTLKEFGKRAAMNSTIQGSAADLIKIAMVKIFNELNSKKYKSKMLLQVHDELIFDIYKDEEKEVVEMIKKCMLNAYKLNVNLDVSIASGKNWLEAK